MGNIFNRQPPRFIHSRTYNNHIPSEYCELIKVEAVTIDGLKYIRKRLNCSRNLELYKHERQIMRCLKYVIKTHPNIRDIGYFVFRTRNCAILKIENLEVGPTFDTVGRKWFYIDFNLDAK